MVSQVNSVIPCFSSSQEVSSIGVLDVLPTEVVVHILSMLEQPLAVSKVCRRMKVLGTEAVEQQNANRGISAQALAQKLGVSVNPVCLSLLARFQGNVVSMALEDKKETLEELEALFRGNLSLLKEPNSLHAFLSARLLENSLIVAKYFYGPGVSRCPLPHPIEPVEGFLKRCVRNVTQAFRGSPQQKKDEDVEEQHCARTQAVHSVVQVIRKRTPWRIIPVMVVRGGDRLYDPTPAVPLDILTLPPLEVCHQLASKLTSIRIENASRIPRGIGSMSNIRGLYIGDSLLTRLPSEIGQLPLEKLWLENCRHMGACKRKGTLR